LELGTFMSLWPIRVTRPNAWNYTLNTSWSMVTLATAVLAWQLQAVVVNTLRIKKRERIADFKISFQKMLMRNLNMAT